MCTTRSHMLHRVADLKHRQQEGVDNIGEQTGALHQQVFAGPWQRQVVTKQRSCAW